MSEGGPSIIPFDDLSAKARRLLALDDDVDVSITGTGCQHPDYIRGLVYVLWQAANLNLTNQPTPQTLTLVEAERLVVELVRPVSMGRLSWRRMNRAGAIDLAKRTIADNAVILEVLKKGASGIEKYRVRDRRAVA
ncbi:hypothetical protein HZA40_04100 [Candidatus Peregrinibacteria bacterium]|nr:hypothetical protein [Candidatus Peregrinibacteria bacterium]